MPRRQLLAAAHFALLTFLIFPAMAEQTIAQTASAQAVRATTAKNGLVIDRLRSKDVEKWKSIEKLVFAEDIERQPLHPTIRALWEWIDTSGHIIYIELIRVNKLSTTTAGNFSIERFDPRGQRHIGVIKINIPNIDQAFVGAAAARKNGFIPFANLSKEERYAEVLGHEMAHAVYILTNLERAKMVVEYVDRTNEILLSSHIRRKPGWIAPELKTRLSKRDAILKEIEAQAEMMEVIVWRELNNSKRLRDKE